MMVFRDTKNILSALKVVLIIEVLFNITSCMAVKGYQKMYVNDAEMELAPRRVEYQEMNFQLYREGASGGNGGRAGGGCGCN